MSTTEAKDGVRRTHRAGPTNQEVYVGRNHEAHMMSHAEMGSKIDAWHSRHLWSTAKDWANLMVCQGDREVHRIEPVVGRALVLHIKLRA